MIRKIIHIDEEKCNGCGACANACHEGAIGMVDGKARLLRDDYCDGLGDCLPACPTNAITFVEREAAAYDEKAVKAHLATRELGKMQGGNHPGTQAAPIPGPGAVLGGCPGSRSRMLRHPAAAAGGTAAPAAGDTGSQLSQWPVQIRLVPVQAPYFDGAKLLIAADCTAFACGDFHQRFVRGRITLVGCPKLDPVDYSEKLTEILKQNDIRSVTVVRMQVPCCGGLEMAAKQALQASGKMIPWQVVIVTPDGRIIED